MKKEELLKTLKPLIKECVREVIFEDGALSNIVAEVAQGLSRPTLVESAAPVKQYDNTAEQEALMEQRRREAKQRQQQLLSAIGSEAYGGVNVFEGTAPLSKGGSVSEGPQTQGPLSDVDPNDPGVDISSILGMAGGRWSAHMK